MTALILYVLLWLWDNRTFDSITKTNERKREAEQAYNTKAFEKAAALYRQITYGSIFSEPAARLNLAHSLYHSGEYEEALKHYLLVSKVSDPAIASIANSQIAVIRVIDKDSAGAIANLKTALRIEPGNNTARANYITLKKHFTGTETDSDIRTRKKKSTQPPPPATTQQQTQPVEGREVADDARREELLKSLRDMNMSEDQARAILDAMKSNESQYIYQLRRKQYNTKKTPKGEIEW